LTRKPEEETGGDTAGNRITEEVALQGSARKRATFSRSAEEPFKEIPNLFQPAPSSRVAAGWTDRLCGAGPEKASGQRHCRTAAGRPHQGRTVEQSAADAQVQAGRRGGQRREDGVRVTRSSSISRAREITQGKKFFFQAQYL